MNTREEMRRLCMKCETIGEAQAINRCLDELDRLAEHRRWFDGGRVGPEPQIVAGQPPALEPDPPDATALVQWLYEAPQSRCIVITASPYEVDRSVTGKHPSDLAFRFRVRIHTPPGADGPIAWRVAEATTIARDVNTVDSAHLAECMIEETRLSIARFVQQQAVAEGDE